jgi:isoprenylcysteine carboxyl methyltransferase (ICMT) family protein YpbQ
MRLRRIAPVITIAAAGVGFCGLLPLAFALPGIATPLFRLIIAITFFLWLGGPLILLAAGIRDLAKRSSKLLFLTAFALLLFTVGIFLFWRLPQHGFFLDWVMMTLAIVLILALLRQVWLWAVVGGAWTGILLAIGEAHTVSEYLSPTVRGVPNWTLLCLWLIGCILSLTSCILAFMRRKEAY